MNYAVRLHCWATSYWKWAPTDDVPGIKVVYDWLATPNSAACYKLPFLISLAHCGCHCDITSHFTLRSPDILEEL